ncbi:hypothetical protein [Prochlorococcus sp. MIT 1306]|uniref:hypothetical protein n=1 Tax=Prochlorococcus sp. MIT 1306 TaxID=1799667 RepID=UPI0018D2AE64|nr:hypothetical protein [Prochlorococcus sp. MIT 1306]
MLSRGDLNSQAIDALESFFACDRAFDRHKKHRDHGPFEDDFTRFNFAAVLLGSRI